MKDITVLLTACNISIAFGRIDCFRGISERNVRVIGVDSSEFGAGSKMVDKFYKVPQADSSDYLLKMFEICKNERVDVIVPATDEEVMILSKEKEKFGEINTKIIASKPDTVEKSGDKGLFLKSLVEMGIPSAKFRVPKSIEELDRMCKELGYPEKPVVFKPRKGRGNRGFRLIKSDIDKKDILLNQKPGVPHTTLEDLKGSLSGKPGEEFPKAVLMEYLTGKEYSVDVLAKDGEVLAVVPKIRVLPAPGLSLIAEVEMNDEVIDKVKEICKAFGFDYNINIQLKYSEDGKLYPYEINPRVAATTALCKKAGANVVYYGVKMALGEEIPKAEVKDGMRMVRYYMEQYEDAQDKGSNF